MGSPHPGTASILDLGSRYGFINDNWAAGNSDQCHDSFLCDWLSSSKRLSWEPKLGQSLPPYLVVTSHHQGRKNHQTSKSALGLWGSSSSWSLVQTGQQENVVHSPLVPAAHSPLGRKTSLGAPTLPPPTTRPEANFLLCLKLNEFGGKEQVTFFLPLCISGK